jgi:hypothetical protein
VLLGAGQLLLLALAVRRIGEHVRVVHVRDTFRALVSV